MARHIMTLMYLSITHHTDCDIIHLCILQIEVPLPPKMCLSNQLCRFNRHQLSLRLVSIASFMRLIISGPLDDGLILF